MKSRELILREAYVANLRVLKDTSVIKVITGIRRSGKSSLLLQFHEDLIASGVATSSIININFESMQYESIKDYGDLYTYISDRRNKTQKTYLLLDEIQRVKGWEKAISSFQVDFDCDIYITGSNAYLLSSELATFLSGRYVEIHVLPLSFKEFASAYPKEAVNDAFKQYMKYGGFPGLLEMVDQDEVKRIYLEGIFNTVVVKDIIARSTIKDVDLLNRILRYLIDNIGNLISATKIADFLTSNNRTTQASTVIDYLTAFENAFIVYRAHRYRIHGKQQLRSPDKFYVVDIGFRSMVHAFESFDTGRVLENIVYVELIRRGYHVHVGADPNFEIDFVAIKGVEKKYYQVTLSMVDENVKAREVSGFKKINDNYPKTILSMDYISEGNIDGILHQNIIEFLLQD